MDKTLEIVIAVSVLLMTAVSVMFMVSDRGSSFGQWTNDTQQGATCDLLKAEYENSCSCEPSPSGGDSDALADAQGIDGCTWAEGGYSCNQYCN